MGTAIEVSHLNRSPTLTADSDLSAPVAARAGRKLHKEFEIYNDVAE